MLYNVLFALGGMDIKLSSLSYNAADALVRDLESRNIPYTISRNFQKQDGTHRFAMPLTLEKFRRKKEYIQ